MSKETYVLHQEIEVEGFQIVDSTSAGGLRPHDDVVWVGRDMAGCWLSPLEALELAAAIKTVANNNLLRRGLLDDGRPQSD